MSTEDDQSIMFNIAHNRQKYRLLELPPDLLELVSSTAPSQLILKSNVPTGQDPGNAVICSHDRTFQLRQVHSSNSVFVLHPSQDGELTVVAKCEATLEAIPQTPPCLTLLQTRLSVFSGQAQREVHPNSQAQSKQSVLADTPVSTEQFNRAWVDLCAFEMEGQSWRPSSNMLWKTWKSIASASTIKGLPLNQASNFQTLATMVEDDEIPVPLFNAVVERLQDETITGQACTRLDPMKTISWTGLVLLQSKPQESVSLIKDFLNEWRDQLPEPWREQATLDALGGKFVRPSNDTITFDENGSIAERGLASAAEAKTTRPQARKWHEKFKSTRR